MSQENDTEHNKQYGGLISITELIKHHYPHNWGSQSDKQRGSAVHRACHYYNEDALKLDSVSPELMPYLEGWKAFKEMYKPEIIFSEHKLISDVWQIGGTFDVLADIILRNNKKPSLVLLDIKSGQEHFTHGIQLAGYSFLVQSLIGLKIKEAWGVYLTKEGRFKIKIYNEPCWMTWFMALLNKYTLEKKYKVGGKDNGNRTYEEGIYCQRHGKDGEGIRSDNQDVGEFS